MRPSPIWPADEAAPAPPGRGAGATQILAGLNAWPQVAVPLLRVGDPQPNVRWDYEPRATLSVGVWVIHRGDRALSGREDDKQSGPAERSRVTFGFLQRRLRIMSPRRGLCLAMWGWVSGGFDEFGLGWNRLDYVGLRAPFRAPQAQGTVGPAAAFRSGPLAHGGVTGVQVFPADLDDHGHHLRRPARISLVCGRAPRRRAEGL
jgi:hypothetical protein